MNIDKFNSIEELAATIRARLYVYDAFPLDLSTAIDQINDLPLNPRGSITVLPKAKMRFEEAYTDGETNKLFISEEIFEGIVNGTPRARFTFAHELGHLVMHDGVRSRAIYGHEFRKQAGVKGAAKDKSEADNFAAAFLMPVILVRKCSSPQQLAELSKASLTAATVRFEQVKKRDRRELNELRPIPEKTQDILNKIFRDGGRGTK